MANDVFPRTALPQAAESWGRAITDAVRANGYKLQNLGAGLASDSRTQSGKLSALSRQLQGLESSSGVLAGNATKLQVNADNLTHTADLLVQATQRLQANITQTSLGGLKTTSVTVAGGSSATYEIPRTLYESFAAVNGVNPSRGLLYISSSAYANNNTNLTGFVEGSFNVRTWNDRFGASTTSRLYYTGSLGNPGIVSAPENWQESFYLAIPIDGFGVSVDIGVAGEAFNFGTTTLTRTLGISNINIGMVWSTQ